MNIFDISLFWIHVSPSYYGLAYALWFLWWYLIVRKRIAINQNILDSLVFYVFLWVIFWWRIWYVLFYNFSYYADSPLNVIKIWEWGMSFHWWVLGVIVALVIFSKRYTRGFLEIADEVVAVLPIWLWLGRIWNYMNKELLGYFPYDGWFAVYVNDVWYFPSPLLEAFLEWWILCIILNMVYKKKQFDWQIASLFLVLYGVFRFFVEVFFRLPDAHIWYVVWGLSLWALLTVPMILLWLSIYIYLCIPN
jgi:phosphatidylglycerol:prolipoprotein diacylglycerol transferase